MPKYFFLFLLFFSTVYASENDISHIDQVSAINVEQYGNSNLLQIDEIKSTGNIDILQNGNFNSTALLRQNAFEGNIKLNVEGEENQISSSQDGKFNNSIALINGNQNTLSTLQLGDNNTSIVGMTGNNNSVSVSQTGNDMTSIIGVTGNNNRILVNQSK